MLKRPEHSKRRIAGALGSLADELAALLLECALADLKRWPGSVCLAPAHSSDLGWAEGLLRTSAGRRYLFAQRDGNLGERIMQVDGLLRTQGESRIIMLGTDCPALDDAYLATANVALGRCDVVLGPARDGGVVLMGAARPWPNLANLPWSTATLGEQLLALCTQAGCRVEVLDDRSDIDTLADIGDLLPALRNDPRDSRRALATWLDVNQQRLERAS